MRLLLVEDDVLLASGIKLGLTNAGYAVDWVGNGERAREVLRTESFDIAVIDIGLPGMDGLELTRHVRRPDMVNPAMPVLILTARDALQDRVNGLDYGADDYMLKPYELPELLARLRALLRRSQAATTAVLSFGPLELDTARRSLSTGLGIGSRLPVYCSAIGRMLLSGLPQQEARARLEMIERVALTPHTVTDLEELLGLLETCRQSGWSCSEGELELGVRSMAAPVRDPQGNTIAAMSIAVRAERLSMSEFKETFLMPLKRARNELEKKLYPQGM